MFEFRIINLANGNQIIDPSLKTPYNSLTPLQMVEYTEMDVQLDLMDRLEREKRRKEEKCKQNFIKNLACKVACFLYYIAGGRKMEYIIQIGENDENMVDMELTQNELEKFIEFAKKLASQSNNEILCAVSNKYDDYEHFSNVFEWRKQI